MDDLIEALTIFRKYTDTKFPTHCEHDVLMVNVSREVVSREDQERLKELSFTWDPEYGSFTSLLFGSC